METSETGHTLLFDIWVVANSTRSLLDQALHHSGLSAEEFALYSAVRGDGGVTPTQLAALMALPATTVSSIVARLERRGHLMRIPNPDDGRSYRIQLTTTGQAAHTAAAKLFGPLLAKVHAALTVPLPQALATLADINSAVRQAATGSAARVARSEVPAGPVT
jgi:DNA-binding MarR family transcriptional regulator